MTHARCIDTLSCIYRCHMCRHAYRHSLAEMTHARCIDMLSCIYRCHVHVDTLIDTAWPTSSTRNAATHSSDRGDTRCADEQHTARRETLQQHTAIASGMLKHCDSKRRHAATAVASGMLRHCDSKRWHAATAEAPSSGRPGTTGARRIAAEHSLRQNAETANSENLG